MIDRTLFTHASLAVAASALALVAWLSPKGVDESELTLIAGDAGALTAVEYQDSEAEVTLRKDGSGARVELRKRRDVKKEGEGEQSVEPPPLHIYPGTDKAKGLFAELMPLPAVRRLGPADPARLPTFGLDKPVASLRLVLGERTHELQIGNATYGGNTVYVRAQDGDVYLMKSSKLTDFKAGANSLIERQLLNVPREKVARLVIGAGTQRRELVHRNAEQRGKAFYADPSDAEKRLNLATSWVDRVLRLRVIEPSAKKPDAAPALSLEVLGESGALGKLSLWPASGGSAVAESSMFSTPVTIAGSTVESILKDIEAVLTEK